jgi:hypothetical protein
MKAEKVEQIDWKGLLPGDTIRVKGGPYFLRKNCERIPMGYRGKFKVSQLDKNGIHAYGNKKEGENSHCFIYMGPRVYNKETGLYMKKHLIFKTKAKA